MTRMTEQLALAEPGLPRRTVATYAVGSLGTGGFSTLPGLVLVYFLTDTLGVVPLAAGLLVTVAKVWDVLIDPVIGAQSDRDRARTGSRRRFMTLGAVLLPVAFALTFAVPAGLSPFASGLWVLVAFVLAATAFSLFQVPYIALPAELSDDYDARTRLLAARVVVLTLAILLFGAGGPALRRLGGADENAGYLIMGLVAAVVLGVALLVATRSAPRGPVATVPPRVALFDHYRSGLAALRRSAPFRTLWATFVLQGLATGLMLATAQYVATWVLSDEAAVDLLFVALIAPAIGCAPLWSLVARRVGKERALMIASVIFGVAALSLVVLAWAPGRWVYLPVALAGAAYAGLQTLPLAMLPDVVSVDARTWRPGQAGTFGGVWTAGETAGMALGTTLLTLVLTATGYRASLGSAEAVQPAAAVTGIVLAFSRGTGPAARAQSGPPAPLPAPTGAGRRGAVVRTAPGDDRRMTQTTAEIMARLARLRSHDAPTHGGHVLSYVYDSGLAELDELAAVATRAVQPLNGLDPTTFGSVAVIERELVAFVRDLLHGGADDGAEAVVGSVTSGGTESCLLAVKTARELWRARHPEGLGSDRPRLLAPTTVHAAFHKAAAYFDLELDLVPVPPSGKVDAEAFAARLGPDVALAVVSAPSYPHGALDPVAAVAAACVESGVALHVDACIGGLVLPFRSGLPPWDFAVPGVTSLSVDLHKYGYAPKGVSVLLQRGRDRQRAQYFATTSWPGYPVVNATLLGSKSVGPMASAWAIVQRLGVDGLGGLAAQTLAVTDALRAAIDDIDGLRVVGDPVGPLFAVTTDESMPPERRVDPHRWADASRARGWVLQPQPGCVQPDGTRLPSTTHLTVTPVTASVLEELVAGLVAAADEIRGVPAVNARSMLSGLPPLAAKPDAATAAAVLRGLGLLDRRHEQSHAAGYEGDWVRAALPPETAPLLAAVEALPAPVAEALLVELLARLVE